MCLPQQARPRPIPFIVSLIRVDIHEMLNIGPLDAHDNGEDMRCNKVDRKEITTGRGPVWLSRFQRTASASYRGPAPKIGTARAHAQAKGGDHRLAREKTSLNAAARFPIAAAREMTGFRGSS